MQPPRAELGLVVRYEYLWHRRSRSGAETDDKDRPVLIIDVSDDGKRVVLLPITHSAPSTAAEAIELPQKVKAHLGLDAARSWVAISEGNLDVWQSPDLRPIPRSSPNRFDYGFLPPRLFRTIRDAFIEAYRTRRSRLVDRTSTEP